MADTSGAREGRRLVVMSDDFGHCEAVNEGILRAFTDGLLTDTNLQAPCPGFREACALTRQHSVPVGLHVTFTCDWDLVRWKPLTSMKSMVDENGYFLNSVPDAWAGADLDEAAVELRAQYDAIASEGIEMTHLGEHMGVDEGGRAASVMAALAREKNLSHKGHWAHRKHRQGYEDSNTPYYAFDSHFGTSAWRLDLAGKKERLKRTLAALGPGWHMWVVHAAVDHPSLDRLCSQDWHAVRWAREIRAVDYALLTDPEIIDWVEAQGIRPTPIAECPVGD